VVKDDESIEKCVEGLLIPNEEALAVSAPKLPPHADKLPLLRPGIRDEIRLKAAKEAVTSDKGSCFESPGQPPPETHQLNDWRNKQRSDVLDSLDCADQSLCKLTKRVM
jgi:hypothetical protein